MMFQPPDIRVIGPDRYCPDCRRILLKMNEEEETYVISGRTHCTMQGSLLVEDMDEMPEEIEAIPEVYCLRRRCRFKRWRRGEKLPRAPWDEDEHLIALRKSRRAAYILAGAALTLAVVQLAILTERIL